MYDLWGINAPVCDFLHFNLYERNSADDGWDLVASSDPPNAGPELEPYFRFALVDRTLNSVEDFSVTTTLTGEATVASKTYNMAIGAQFTENIKDYKPFTFTLNICGGETITAASANALTYTLDVGDTPGTQTISLSTAFSTDDT